MSSYIPSPSFQSAAKYLSSAHSLSNVSPTTKLELYGLYKRLTTGLAPSASRPSIFDMTGRAKWDAWTQAGKTWVAGKDQEAELRYIEIARSLGWTEGTPTEESNGHLRPEGEDSIWDEEGTTAGTSNRSGGVGLGVSVSILSSEPLGAEDMDTLHGFALSNDLDGLNTFLRTHPGVDIDVRDNHGYTPLHLAADRGHVEVVRRLLEMGADASLKDADEFDAIELARIAEHAEIQALLEGNQRSASQNA